MEIKEEVKNVKKRKFDKVKLYNCFTVALITVSSLLGIIIILIEGNYCLKELLNKGIEEMNDLFVVALDIFTIIVGACLSINTILWVSDKSLYGGETYFSRVIMESKITRFEIIIVAIIAAFFMFMRIWGAISYSGGI